MKKGFAVLVAFVVVVIAAAFGYRQHIISELRKPVLEVLSDPDSAQFRNERLIFGWKEWTVQGNVLCGEVNAKNSMGGYAGYIPFKVIGGMDVDIGNDSITKKIIETTCN